MMEAQTLIFVFAVILFITVAAFSYVPLNLNLSSIRIKQFTAIGAGVLISSAFLVIIPEALDIIENHIKSSTIGLVILCGFVFMLLLETFGFPHAVHHDEDKDIFGFSAVIGLIIHAIADGLLIGASVSSSTKMGLIIFVAIMLHKGPAAFGLSSFLKHIKMDDKKSQMYLILFALSSPIVAILTFFVLKDTSFATDENIGLILLFSAGVFIYVATVDVLPEVHSHDHQNESSILFVILGMILIFLIGLVSHGH